MSSNNNNNKKEKTDCFTSLYQNKTKKPNLKIRKNDHDYNNNHLYNLKRNIVNTNTNYNLLSNKIKSNRDISKNNFSNKEYIINDTEDKKEIKRLSNVYKIY